MPRVKKLEDLEPEVSGAWRLDDRNRLIFTSTRDSKVCELEAALVAAEAESLVVSVTEKNQKGNSETRIVKLEGAWKLDASNQLKFELKRQFGKNRVLAFRGIWEIGEANQLVYTYRVRYLKTKTARLETLTFNGYFDLFENNRLVYLIEGDSERAFRFRGAFQTQSLLAKKGELRYQLGAEVSWKKGKAQILTLFGIWKLSNKLELEFELEYKEGEKRTLKFGAEFSIHDATSISANLVSKAGDPLGIEIILTHDFLKNHAQAFLRLKKSLRESAVEAGVTIPW